MRQRRGTMRAMVLGLTLALVLGACWGGDEERSSADPSGPDDGGSAGPFTIRLGPGEATASTGPSAPLVAGDALDDDEVAAITDRLPEFAGADNDRTEFNRPPETLPRPRVGRTVEEPMGPSDRPPPDGPEPGRLEVLRHQPDGDVDVAPFISVTFNQPMVPVGTLERLDEADVPVRVEPETPGRWRWIGTRTLRFEADVDGVDRLPAATEYTVEVPAGTESAAGSALGEAVRWTFTTPAPRVQSFVPDGDVPEGNVIDTEPVLLVTFDQRVDPEAVIDATTLTAGDETRPVRLATSAEIADDDIVRQRSEQALDGRWVAFRPRDPLPTDTRVVIEVGPGTPSAEGPLRSDAADTHRTRTHAALEVVRTECGHGRACRTGDPFTIQLNNPLDPAEFDPQGIEIDPPMAASIAMYDSSIVIQGATTANTSYEVTLPASLRDRFGQTLGDAETVTFEVGDAAPFLRGFPNRLVTVDPFADTPQVSLTSSGQESLEVSLYAVGPDDHPGYLRFMNNWNGDRLRGLPGWRRVGSATVRVGGEPGEVSETQIDLAPALPDGTGHVVVVVEPTKTFPRDSEDYWMSRPTIAWVQATGIGVDAVADHDRLVAWATDLRDGTPIRGATVRLLGEDPATTGGDGLATIRLGRAADALLVEHDGDSALLSADHHGSWQAAPRRDTARWSVFDDRGIYRPGEEVHVKGWVRRLTLTEDARIRPVGDGVTVAYVVRDAFGNELASDTADLSSAGGFDFAVDLPDGAALGPAHIELSLTDADGITESGFAHQFLVEEFRRPEFEVITRAESAGPHVLTGPVTVAAEAGYFAGGPLADAPITWQVTTQPTSYAPPNWSDFTFGTWKPPWFDGFGHGGGQALGGSRLGGFGYEEDFGPCCPPPSDDEEHHTYESRTDATGADHLRLDFEGDVPDEPITVSANAAVEDVNRQSFASTVDLLVHPASLYVGLRSSRTFVRQGDALDIEAVVTDIDGAAIAGRELTVTAARVVETWTDGEMTEDEVDPQECEVTTGDEPVSCSLDTDVGGRYRVTSTVTDDDGGRSRTELTRWVSGADAIPSRGVDEEQVTIIPADPEHKPGDTAELLVIAPFSPAQGLLTVSRNGIEETRVFEISAGSTVLELGIDDGDIPGLDVRVDLAGVAVRTRDDGSTSEELPPRPAFATGSLTIPVTATSKSLDVTAVPRDRNVEPGGSTEVAVSVEDASGRPVAGAEVAVVVVDEAVLSLVGYELPDPVADMHQPLMEQLRADHSRRTLLLADPEVFGAENAPATTIAGSESFEEVGGDLDDSAGGSGEAAMDSGAAGSAPSPQSSTRNALTAVEERTPIDVRTDFDALAVFAPALPTGADGTATVAVTVPDNLTRYRVMAVAADTADRFGAGESTITARLPLMVRPSAPRFVNFGDRFELPVVVHNQGDDRLDVEVVVETANLSLTGPVGQRVTVPAGERVEVRFPVAVEDAGTARFRATAVSGTLADSSSGEFPAYTPATTEAFATYGVVDDAGAVAQPLLAPEGVFPQFGGLEIDTSSTAVQALTDAVVYLSDYRYESADAYASRIIALVALRDVFAAFDTPGTPSPEELSARVRADIEELGRLQNEDGGFSTWQRGRPADPYATVQATHALVAAAAAGYTGEAGARDRALAYVADIEAHFPTGYPESARHTVSAYALSVRALAGDRDPAKAEALYGEADLALDALAWLWTVVDDPDIDAAIEDTFGDRVTETPAAATFTTDYDEGAEALVLASDRRTDGIVLDALITERPQSDLVPKVVAGLVGNQVEGRWSNVQENGFILLALKRYFDTFESVEPAFVARTWLGDEYFAEHGHQGRSIDTTRTLVPMGELAGDAPPGTRDIVIAKDGPGRLYYRLGLRYAPTDLSQGPRDEGFVVERTYEAVDDPDDVRRDDDGTWHIEPGAMVRVRLAMVADSARTNMALVDPLPAGLEIVNPALAASPRPPPDDDPDGEGDGGDRPFTSFGWTWFDHQQSRDDRAEAFSSYLPAGTYDYTYVARATTPGTFVAPPARAEEIYAPEVFGRSGTDTVVVSDG